MTTVFLVRHGETVWHADNRYAGSSDVALTPMGIAQAGELAEWAATANVSGIISSDLQRAIDTAAPSAARLGITAEVDSRLRELDFGAAEGMTRAEMHLSFPDELSAFLRTPADAPLPGGESPLAAEQRLRSAFDAVCRAHPDGRMLIVMHSTALRLLLCGLLGLELNEYRRVFPEVANVAITTLRAKSGTVGVLGYNVPPLRDRP